MTFIYYVLLTLFLVLSAFLMLLVLIQKGRGGGLASAFGGVGGNTAFGAKTGDVLTWATSIVFGVFLLLAIGLNLIADNLHQQNTQLITTPSSATDSATPLTAPSLDQPLETIPPAVATQPATTAAPDLAIPTETPAATRPAAATQPTTQP